MKSYTNLEGWEACGGEGCLVMDVLNDMLIIIPLFFLEN
jgi:hypothetical protein